MLNRVTPLVRHLGTQRPRLDRGDIQGLRALAVLAVVADHAWGQPVGGFVGVDVFFVLSGFLITGLLLAEQEEHGSLRYLDFYRRRVRRLLPAIVLVLGTTVVAAICLLSAARARTILVDALWSLVFAANWHIAAAGTDYFAADGFTSPLQHFWSLAVEEQFYLVWPTVIVLVLGAARARRRLLLAVTALIVLGSFAYSMHHTATSPTWAYFSTLDRAWELGVGALVAQATASWRRIPHAVRPVLGWLGLALIVVSLAVVRDGPGFPAPYAALPVVGTALVLIAGTGAAQTWLFPLVNPVARYLGDISYSLYLWHFPVLIIWAARFGDAGALYRVGAPVLAVALAAASYHLFENPIRHSMWLEPRRRREFGERSPSLTTDSGVGLRWLAIGAVAMVAVVAAVVRPTATSDEQVLAAGAAPASGSATPQADYLRLRLEQSLALDRFPDLNPPLDQLGIQNFYSALVRHGCATVLPDDVERCQYGDPAATKTAVVYGDSFAMAYLAGVRKALEPLGYRIHQLTLQDCPVWSYVRTKSDGSPFPECAEYRTWALEQIRALHPDLLILATAYQDAATLVSGATGADAAAEVDRGVSDVLGRLRGDAERTVVLASPPGTGSLQTCDTPGSSPEDCVADISVYWRATRAIESREARLQGADYLDTSPWFCLDDRCPAVVGNTPVAYEGNHLTYEYSAQLGPVLAEALFPRSAGQAGQVGQANPSES